MKQIITEKDIKILTGKFIVQLNAKDDDPCMVKNFEKSPEFWLEKRISFVCHLYNSDGLPAFKKNKDEESNIILSGIYYCHGIYPLSQFISYWNYYEFGDKTTQDKYRNTRYHRLLTNKEMDWLNKELQK